MAWDDGLEGRAYDIAVCEDSPLRVIAGPGTGKTFSLMRRVARLLENGLDPSRILLVTFTRVAARDLENELETLNAPNARLIRKGTLHSFCFSTLNQAHVLEFTGRTPRPILTFEERFLIEDLSTGDFGNYYSRRARLRAFEAAWAREQDQQPGWPEIEIDREFQSALDEWLRFHQSMLVGELILLTLRYLQTNPGCPELMQYDHVLVDEYQDLNRAEQSLIDLLSRRGSLSIIGDEDQSIYENFRYAHPEGISRFHENHQGTVDIPLYECRRCPTGVVQIANDLIRNNRRRTGRVLNDMPGNPEGQIFVVQWSSMEEEAENLARYIASKIESREFNPGKTLVLCPRRQFGYMIRDAIRLTGNSAHSYFHEEALEGNPKILAESRSQQAITLLRLLCNPGDLVSLRCWLGFGSPNLRVNEYSRLREYSSNTGLNPREILDGMINGELKISYTSRIKDRYYLLLQYQDDSRDRPTREVFDAIFPEDEEWAVPLRTIAEETVGEWTLENVLDSLITNITQPELPTDVGFVRIMSLHKSKGLNADHVIVTGLIEGLIPSRIDDVPFEERMRYIEEQRRLFYVAITRPKRTLVLSSVLSLPRDLAHRMRATVGEGDQFFTDTIASSFLSELGPSCPQPIQGYDWVY